MSGHDKESPSSLQQKRLCAGSGNAQRGLPDTFSPSSILGDAAHDVLSQAITGEAHILDHESLHINVETPGYKEDITMVKLDSEDLDFIRVAYDYVLSKWTEGVEVYSEIKVDPAPFIGTRESKGTSDLVILDRAAAHVEIPDYKHGIGVVVEIEGCLQIITYGLGVLAWMDSEGVRIETITLTVIQPRAPHKDGVIRSITVTRDELLDWVPVIKDVIKKSRDPKAKRTAGEYQCQFCKAKRDCVAVTEHAVSVARATFKPLGKVTNDDIGDSLVRDPNCLTPAQRALVLENATLIRGWLDAVSKHAWMEDLNGRRTPGFKVVEGTSKRAFVDDEAVTLEALVGMRTLDKKRLSIKDVTVSKLLTPKQLTKRLKPLLSEKAYKTVEALIKKPVGTMTMAPDTDPRPAVRKDAKDVFSPIGQRKSDLSFME